MHAAISLMYMYDMKISVQGTMNEWWEGHKKFRSGYEAFPRTSSFTISAIPG